MRVRTATLILTVALGPLAVPLLAEAQKAGKVHRVGVLTPVHFAVRIDDAGRCHKEQGDIIQGGLCQGLREQGYVEYLRGGNLRMLYEYDPEEEEASERLPQMAASLIRAKVDLILAVSTPAAVAAKKATRTIPIVFVGVADPVAAGLVAGLARPGGNVTGVANILPELAGKQLELLKEAIPRMSRVAVLWNPRDQASTLGFKQAQVAARTLGLALDSHPVSGPDDFERAFTVLGPDRADGVLVIPASTWVLGTSKLWIVHAMAQSQLPAMFWRRGFVEAGALMGYGPSFPHLGRRVAALVAKILKGTKPADLPVERPTKFDLVINLKTAKTLGLTIPPSVLVRADRVIE